MEVNKKKSVIFICTHNSARSQIAEGYLKEKASNKYDVFSAGTEPTQINPYAVKVMQEIGIDISQQRAKTTTQFLERQLELVVTVCDSAKASCPHFPGGKKYIHKGFQDPSSIQGTENEKLSGFRKVRDEIISWIDSEFL